MRRKEMPSKKFSPLFKIFLTTLLSIIFSASIFAVSTIFESKPFQTKSHNQIVSKVNLFHPKVKVVAMAKWPNTIVFQNIDTWKTMGTIEAHDNQERIIYSMVFSPTGKYIAAGIYDTKVKESMVLVWEVENSKLVATYKILCKPETIDFSHNGKHIAVAGSYEMIKGAAQLIDISKGTVKTIWSSKHYEEWTATRIKFMPVSNKLAITMVNKKSGILFYDTETAQTNFFPTQADTYTIDFTKDGKFMVSGGGNETSGTEILIWNLTTKKITTKLKGHTSFVNSVKFTADGKQIISSAYEKGTRFRVWDISLAKEIQLVSTENNRSKNMEISPNGEYLVFEIESFGNAGNPTTIEFYRRTQK